MTLKLQRQLNADKLWDYYMVLDGKVHKLNEVPKIGTFYDARIMRRNACAILQKEIVNIPTLATLMLLVETSGFEEGVVVSMSHGITGA